MTGKNDDVAIISDIKKYAVHDGPGIRTTVFFKGCPLECWWCHNPECLNQGPEIFSVKHSRSDTKHQIMEKVETIGRNVSVWEVLDEIKKDIIFYDQSGGGVTMSGGEPMMQIDFLEKLLKECGRLAIHRALDTSGYAPADDFKRIYDLVDLILFDLKIIDDNRHIDYTGVSNQRILENLSMLAKLGNKVNIRIPLIPGITDTGENIEAIIEFLDSIRNINNVSLLPYNRFGEDKRRRFGIENRLGKLETQNIDDVRARAKIFEKHGYRVKIGG